MTKFTRTVSAAVAFLIGATSPAAHALPHPSLMLSWDQIDGFPSTLVLRLKNSGSRAVCVPDVDSKERISFTQFGSEVEPFSYLNRAVLEWRGADLISGFIVVPPRRRVDIYYDLNEWTLKGGRATASIAIPVYDCLEFFRQSSPHPARANSHYEFDAVLSVAPKY
jgi:hypothetical protein